MRTFVMLLFMFVVTAVQLAIFSPVFGELIGHVFFGWCGFVSRSCQRLTWNWYGVATAALCLALLFAGGHPFLRWLVESIRSAKSGPTNGLPDGPVDPARAVVIWTWTRTAQLLFVFILLFAAGTAIIGLVHQAAWLATAPEPLTRYRLNVSFTSHNNLRYGTNMGVVRFVSYWHQCPPNGPAPELKQASHSWQTRILRFAGVRADNIDMQRDWDDEKNAPAFRRFVEMYLNPDIGVLRDSRGYAVSHYAGNSRLFARPRPMTGESLTKSESNTIVCGEVVTDFKAWGDPANVRDPAEGVNETAAGFGSTNERGAQFLMLDGSVRFLATGTDRQVLRALAGD
ncbi:MAG TPA: H-X9-DG-CTERM domain-containing protein [Pirellulales bacterium]|nr:H-X9-DG-CTERM domain-containing protein [Pirellulales bacterium]